MTPASTSTLSDLRSHLANAELANGNTYSCQVTYNGDPNNSVTVACASVTPATTRSTATGVTGAIIQQ
jgi:hypothetical protein